MSKTLKHKIHHIFRDENGKINLRLPLKLRWSYINRIRRHNFDCDLERAKRADKRDRENEIEMGQQIEDALKQL